MVSKLLIAATWKFAQIPTRYDESICFINHQVAHYSKIWTWILQSDQNTKEHDGPSPNPPNPLFFLQYWNKEIPTQGINTEILELL